MKSIFCLLGVIGLLGAAAPSTRPAIPFTVHDGYFVRNDFEPNEPTSFAVATDQETFDRMLHAVPPLMPRNAHKPHHLPKGVFATKVVAVAIHRGNALWDYNVEGVTTHENTLVVKYTARSKPDPACQFACPLIVSIDKGNYAAVEFVENGKSLKTVKVPVPD